MTARHLLILGGTGEAAALARGALARFGESLTVTTALAGMLAGLGADPAAVAAAADADSAGAILDLAGDRRAALAASVAWQAREVALATLSGNTAVEVAIVDRVGDFLARAGAEA